jgi:hypothetical protein
MKNDLNTIYKQAAQKAHTDGIAAGDEAKLVEWICSNCRFDEDKLFFLVLGIGCELADIEARKEGFENGVHKAFNSAAIKLYGRVDNIPQC